MVVEKGPVVGGCREQRSLGPLCTGLMLDDLDLASEDSGEDFHDLVARDARVEADEVAADGRVDIPAHLLSCLLLLGAHGRMACCGRGRRAGCAVLVRIWLRMGSR